MGICIHWFRRDLRLKDNHGLSEALASGHPVLGLFIFDTNILEDLEADDARVTFIHNQLLTLKKDLNERGGELLVVHNTSNAAWLKLLDEFTIAGVTANEDYEPYAISRDKEIHLLLAKHSIPFSLFKDQVIFEKEEIVKEDGSPYTVYTPYKNKYLSLLKEKHTLEYNCAKDNWHPYQSDLPSLSELGFVKSKIVAAQSRMQAVTDYEKYRDYPAAEGTTLIGPQLRFGTISIRSLFRKYRTENSTYINELIWREFFMQILYHFPEVVQRSFRPKYDAIPWRNKPAEFQKWCDGQTGYPLVDAGMRELNQTGFMHNRVRMVVASFLCKHLLIDWRWGEAYFAKKLLDYELSSNNGNWQWAAGTGCDAAPYFRVFNPSTQLEKFDPKLVYVRKWVPEYETMNYPQPMVDHKKARIRAIDTYKEALANY